MDGARFLRLATALLLSSAFLEGCGGLDRRAPSSPPRIEVGKTRKRDVIESLGLPSRMGTASQADGTVVERWFYFKNSDATYNQAEFGMSSMTMRNASLRGDLETVLEFSAAGVVSRILASGEP